MGPFPLLPLPEAWQSITFGASDTLLAIHRSCALVMPLAMWGLGLLLLMMWVPTYLRDVRLAERYSTPRMQELTELPLQRIRDGIVTIGIGVVFLIGGSYALAACLLGLVLYALYALIGGLTIFVKTSRARTTNTKTA